MKREKAGERWYKMKWRPAAELKDVARDCVIRNVHR